MYENKTGRFCGPKWFDEAYDMWWTTMVFVTGRNALQLPSPSFKLAQMAKQLRFLSTNVCSQCINSRSGRMRKRTFRMWLSVIRYWKFQFGDDKNRCSSRVDTERSEAEVFCVADVETLTESIATVAIEARVQACDRPGSGSEFRNAFILYVSTPLPMPLLLQWLRHTIVRLKS